MEIDNATSDMSIGSDLEPSKQKESNKLRSWLEKNKIFIETAIAILALFIAYMQVRISNEQTLIAKDQANLTEMQMILSSDPILSLDPTRQFKEENATFKLTLKNIGISDVIDIELYKNMFMSPSGLGANEKMVFSIKSMYTAPFKTYPILKHNESIPLDLEIAEMLDDGEKNMINFLRLRIDFKRQLDGKQYSVPYVFTANKTMLIDVNSEAMSAIPAVKLARQILLGKI